MFSLGAPRLVPPRPPPAWSRGVVGRQGREGWLVRDTESLDTILLTFTEHIHTMYTPYTCTHTHPHTTHQHIHTHTQHTCKHTNKHVHTHTHNTHTQYLIFLASSSSQSCLSPHPQPPSCYQSSYHPHTCTQLWEEGRHTGQR